MKKKNVFVVLDNALGWMSSKLLWLLIPGLIIMLGMILSDTSKVVDISDSWSNTRKVTITVVRVHSFSDDGITYCYVDTTTGTHRADPELSHQLKADSTYQVTLKDGYAGKMCMVC